MGLGGLTPGRRLGRERERSRGRPPTAAEIAWLALAPCALLVLAAIVVLGPPLGGALFPPSSGAAWPSAAPLFRPEPTEQARYLVALSAPLLLTAAIALAARRAPLLRAATIARGVLAVQALGAIVAVACVIVQRRTVFGTIYTAAGTSAHTVYFRLPTLLVALAIAAAIAASVRGGALVERIDALTRESRGRRIGALAVALLVLLISLLPGFNVEDTILGAAINSAYHVQFPFDEAYAVLDGRSPLVDFAAQYSSLWPYALAGAMSLVGGSVGVFTILTLLLTGSAMLAVLALLRRVVGRTLLAVALFLPLLATSFYMMNGPAANRYSLVNLYGAMPLRYAGPLLLAWLTARHLDGAQPRRGWLLFLAAGLVVLNNGDFGLPALGATLAALLWAALPTRAGVLALAREVGIGLAGALALVCALTLAHAHALPHLGLLLRYARLFAVSGFGMLPIKPLLGVSTLIYLTYVAAIATATVRAVESERDRLLTGLLAWSGVFGLGAGAYYVGRSHPEVLTNMLPAWALCLTLLLVVTIRSMLRRAPRLPTPAQAACLVGFGVLVCSLAQTPTPWSQVQRLEGTARRAFDKPFGQPFVAAHTRRGEAVAILTDLGHRVAANVGVVDVEPYTGEDSIPTVEQLRETLGDLRRAGGHTVFLSDHGFWPEIPAALREAGFRRVAHDARVGIAAYSDL